MDTEEVGHLAAFSEPEVVGDIEDVVEEGDGKLYLTQLEMTTLELLIERIKGHNERMKILQLGDEVRKLQADIHRKNSEIALLEAYKLDQPDRKVVSARETLNTLITQATKAKDAFADELKEKYSITDPNFGFNPDTGEIVEKLGGADVI